MYIERSKLKFNSDLRAQAREQLAGNWSNAVLVALFSFMIIAASAITVIGPLLLTGPFLLGASIFTIHLARKEEARIENAFEGFNRFAKAFTLYILMMVFTFLWTLLFVIPGIIAYLRYSLSFYVLNDNPEMDASAALERSKELMKGQKGKLFTLYLSFIGWAFLCTLTLGIGYLWLAPYVQTSVANFYENVKNAHA